MSPREDFKVHSEARVSLRTKREDFWPRTEHGENRGRDVQRDSDEILVRCGSPFVRGGLKRLGPSHSRLRARYVGQPPIPVANNLKKSSRGHRPAEFPPGDARSAPARRTRQPDSFQPARAGPCRGFYGVTARVGRVDSRRKAEGRAARRSRGKEPLAVPLSYPTIPVRVRIPNSPDDKWVSIFRIFSDTRWQWVSIFRISPSTTPL